MTASATDRLRAVLTASLLLLSVVAGSYAFTGAVAAASGGNISVSPNTTSAVANTAIHVTPDQSSSGQKGNSLSDVYVDYTTGSASAANVSDVGRSDVTAAYVVNTTTGQRVADMMGALDKVSHEQSGHKVVFSFNNSRTLKGDERYVIKYGNVTNPSSGGSHEATVGFNTNTGVTTSYSLTDVTPPDVGVNATAHGQRLDVNLTSDEALGSLTAGVSGSANRTLHLADFTKESTSNGYRYVDKGVVTGQDGHYTATVENASDTHGNAITSTVSDTATADTVPVRVVNGTTTPRVVNASTTVTQNVTVDVANYSRDGRTDSLAVTFPNETHATLNGVTANTSVVGTNLEGDTATVKLDSGRGGGTTDTAVTLNVTQHVPNSADGRILPVNATATDSDGDTSTVTNVTSTRVRPGPLHVSNFTLAQVGGSSSQHVNVSFDATNPLTAATVSVSGDANRTLHLANVTRTERGPDDYYYTGTAVTGRDGHYTATLQSATDRYGQTASGNSAATTVNTVSIRITGGNVTNRTVAENTTVAQTVTVDLAGVSQDGSSDRVRVHFPSALGVTLHGASSPNGSVSVSNASFDGSTHTASLDVHSGSGGGTRSLAVAFDANVTYPSGSQGAVYLLNASATDSDGDTASATNVTSTRVRDPSPVITNYTVAQVSDTQQVDVAFNVTESLSSATVQLGGDANGTLHLGDLTRTRDGSDYHYVGNVSAGRDGEFWANLTSAADENGDQTDTYAANASVNTVGIAVTGGNVSNGTVHPSSTVNETVTVHVTGASRDGQADTVTLSLPNSVSGNVTGVRATSGGVSVASWSASNDSVTAHVDSGSGGGTTAFTLAVDAATTYPESADGANATFAASATDSDGDTADSTTVANVSVVDETPRVTNFTLLANGQHVDLEVNATEPLQTLGVNLSGDMHTTLSRADFRVVNGTTHAYRANVSDGADGSFGASLSNVNATDDEGTHVANDHRDSLTVNTTHVRVTNASVNRTVVPAGATANETFTVSARNYTRDGGTDTLSLAVPANTTVSDAAASVTNGSASVTGANASSQTITVSLDTGDARGTTDVTVAIHANVTTPDAEGRVLPVDATATDSDGDSDSASNATVLRTRDTIPRITNYTVSQVNHTQRVTVAFNVSKRLASATVELGGDATGSRSLSDLTATQTDTGYRYVGNVSSGEDGEFWANLTSAADANGDHTDTYAANATVHTVPITVANVSVSPGTVDEGSTVNQTATVSVTGVSRDGKTDDVGVTFPNATTALSVRNASVARGPNASANRTAPSLAGSVQFTDSNGDGNADTALVPLAVGSGGGTASVTVTITASARYPDGTGGQTDAFDAAAADSDGSTDGASDAATVSVRTVRSGANGGNGGHHPVQPAPPAKPMRVRVLHPSQTNTTVAAEHYDPGTPVNTSLPGLTNTSREGVAPTALHFTAARQGNVSVVLKPNATAAGVDPLTANATAVIGYYAVNATHGTDLRNANVTLSVGTNYFWSPTPQNTRVYRYSDGSWTPAGGTAGAVANGTFPYTVATDGHDAFAVAVSRPDVTLRNATLLDDRVNATGNATVALTAENTGDAPGVYMVDVTANGSVLDRHAVSVPAGTTTNATVPVTAPAGNYTLSVNGHAAGNLTVTPAPNATDTQNETTQPTTTPTTTRTSASTTHAANDTTTHAHTTTATTSTATQTATTTRPPQHTTTDPVSHAVDTVSNTVSDTVDAVSHALNNLF